MAKVIDYSLERLEFSFYFSSHSRRIIMYVGHEPLTQYVIEVSTVYIAVIDFKMDRVCLNNFTLLIYDAQFNEETRLHKAINDFYHKFLKMIKVWVH